MLLLITLFGFISLTFAQLLPDQGVNALPVNPISEASHVPELPTQAKTYKYLRRPIDVLPQAQEKQAFLTIGMLDSNSTSTYSDSDNIKSSNNSYVMVGEYGFTDLLALNISQNYSFGQETVSGSSTYKDKGAYDPTLTLKIRPMDVSKNRFDLNINPYYSPSLGTSISSTSTKSGNQRKGYDVFGIKLGWGRRDVHQSWAFFVDLSQKSEGSSKNATTSQKTKNTSTGALEISGTYQKPVSNLVTLEISGGFNRIGFIDYKKPDGKTYTQNVQTRIFTDLISYFEIYPKRYLSLDLGLARQSGEYFYEGEDSVQVTTNITSFGVGFLAAF